MSTPLKPLIEPGKRAEMEYKLAEAEFECNYTDRESVIELIILYHYEDLDDEEFLDMYNTHFNDFLVEDEDEKGT